MTLEEKKIALKKGLEELALLYGEEAWGEVIKEQVQANLREVNILESEEVKKLKEVFSQREIQEILEKFCQKMGVS